MRADPAHGVIEHDWTWNKQKKMTISQQKIEKIQNKTKTWGDKEY